MRYDLSALARRARNPRRKAITLRDIVPPAVLASDLYRSGYAPIVAHWQRTAVRLNDEYARTLSGLTSDSTTDLTSILNDADTEMRRLILLLQPSLRSWTLRVESWFRGKWIGAILSATGVDMSTMLGPDDVAQPLEEILGWNVNLVQDVSQQARGRISNAIFEGLRARSPARDVAKRVQEATGFVRDRSIRIASDQLAKLTSSIASERRRQAGLSVYEWRHSRKLHPRVNHQHRDGHLFTDDPKMVGREVDGKTVEAEPPRDDQPGQKPFCGCRELATLVFD